MPIRNHALTKEFPEYLEKIKNLRLNDLPFREACDEYNELDKQIRQLELKDIPTEDQHFSRMRFHRAHLKDKLYQILRSDKSANFYP
ncbi:YdcH family protein [Ferrimonas lipolytica]|uniref:DUF465 domain-containing protein n=1 Tax=Ferrimonas lipolytica TaxID=2724191 RepID=A0A6H1UKK4_9GAMM|nr:DUF465 domain-containing protein [Ferrimonas lipolytica]QIZ78756.1 DUF465 domain-containing protein [Ferrimonas lipolytica]